MTWLDDLQRRLAIAGARGLGQQVAGQFGRTARGGRQDVWATATTEPVDASAGYAPECTWCPVCRAIRMARDSNPDMASRVGETAGALMSAAQDVVAAVDAALARKPAAQSSTPPNRPPSSAAPAGPASRESASHPSADQEPPDAPPSANGQQA
jgi:hypothetical protein